jgi:hypothetical protein
MSVPLLMAIRIVKRDVYIDVRFSGSDLQKEHLTPWV